MRIILGLYLLAVTTLFAGTQYVPASRVALSIDGMDVIRPDPSLQSAIDWIDNHWVVEPVTAGVSWASLVGVPLVWDGTATSIWSDVTGKPTVWPGTAATNNWSDLTGRPAVWPGTAATNNWSDLTGLPSVWPGTATSAWTDVTGRPAVWPGTAATNNWSDLTGIPSVWLGTATSAWTDITGRPTQWPGTVATCAWSTITGTPASYPGKAKTNLWSDITGKPTTWTGSVAGVWNVYTSLAPTDPWCAVSTIADIASYCINKSDSVYMGVATNMNARSVDGHSIDVRLYVTNGANAFVAILTPRLMYATLGVMEYILVPSSHKIKYDATMSAFVVTNNTMAKLRLEYRDVSANVDSASTGMSNAWVLTEFYNGFDFER